MSLNLILRTTLNCASTSHLAKDWESGAVHIRPPHGEQRTPLPRKIMATSKRSATHAVTSKCTEICGDAVSSRSCSEICLVKFFPQATEKAVRMYAVLD